MNQLIGNAATRGFVVVLLWGALFGVVVFPSSAQTGSSQTEAESLQPESAGAEETLTAGERSQQALAQWLRMSRPGEPHRALASRTGEWDVIYRSWVSPGGAVNEATGKAVREMLLDGRVLEERVDIQLPGPAYSGISHFGFDNVRGEYWWHRFDNLGTWITRSESSTPGADGSVTFELAMTDLNQGATLPASLVVRFDGEDREVHEWHQAGDDGEVFKTVEFVYERAAEEASTDEAEESSES